MYWVFAPKEKILLEEKINKVQEKVAKSKRLWKKLIEQDKIPKIWKEKNSKKSK